MFPLVQRDDVKYPCLFVEFFVVIFGVISSDGFLVREYFRQLVDVKTFLFSHTVCLSAIETRSEKCVCDSVCVCVCLSSFLNTVGMCAACVSSLTTAVH